jgi:hypothetical protein
MSWLDGRNIMAILKNFIPSTFSTGWTDGIVSTIGWWERGLVALIVGVPNLVRFSVLLRITDPLGGTQWKGRGS